MSRKEINDVLLSKARVKILKKLLSKGEMNISQIIDETRLNYNTVVKHLEYLTNAGLVEELRLGRARVFRPNWLNPKVRVLEALLNELSLLEEGV